ncbi:MAG: hypothetical protein AMJ64_05420 [Betaproteobacteria bacterium SG8_39]|nr:MAG: hypothetical protein AMJ64_05420 [Betaproteobacteria bacterium SG8_39]
MAIISSRPSVARIKTRWRKKGARTLVERAGVIGANLWKLSLEIFKHMEKEGFRFGSDRLVTRVLAEFIAFLVQLVDRTVYGTLSESDRATFVRAVVDHLAATLENNQLDLFGPAESGDYRTPFIDLLNARFADYAEFEYSGGEPGYPCLRYFATQVSDAMASGDNKWVVEQMIDIEAPEMVRWVRKLVEQTVAPTGLSASTASAAGTPPEGA